MSGINLITGLAMVLALLGSGPKFLSRDTALEPLSIETPAVVRNFLVEMATTPDQQSKGLMYRKSMASDHGMLFTLKQPREVSFWMKNTFIPLDMLFINREGTIVQIIENAEPHTRTSRRSVIPVSAVLEINGGLSEELGIAPGQTVRHSFFENVDH